MPVKNLISIATLILGEIMVLISITLITKFNSALQDFGGESVMADTYINPNFFRSKTGLMGFHYFDLLEFISDEYLFAYHNCWPCVLCFS